jgi:flagellar basal body-associated protein FliL
MKYNKTSMQRGKMMTILIVVTVATLLVTVTTTQAFAAKNLNSSKSNIYRSTQQDQNIEGGGSGEQVTTNTCNCPSNDIITINQQN